VHILSKVFVVFAAILSVLLSALTIAYASNSGRLVSEFRTEEARASSAATALSLERTQSSERASVLQLQLQGVQDTVANMQGQMATLQQERAQLESDLQAARTSRDALEANISQFRETIETQTNLIAAFREELTTLRDNELAFRRQRLELEDRISDLESQNEVLTQTNRGLQEALAEAQRRLGSASGGSGTPGIDRPVNGRVTSVSTDAQTDRQFIEVSLGTADGVRVGSRIEISRPGLYVADAEVTRVELQSCVATIRQTNRSGARLQEGDTARLLP
jgi:phage shock protein A